jgi:hypothetical protein
VTGSSGAIERNEVVTSMVAKIEDMTIEPEVVDMISRSEAARHHRDHG